MKKVLYGLDSEKNRLVYVKKGTKLKHFKTIMVQDGLGAPGFITL